MNHHIYDNRENKLSDRLKKELSQSKKADFVVGWFFLTGLKEFKEEIDKLDELRIIAGSRTNKATAEIMMLADKYVKKVNDKMENQKYSNDADISKMMKREKKEIIEHISRVKPSEENKEFINWLFDKLQEGKIKVRLYPKETLHAKLYLTHKIEEGIAFVGSSNLSLSGISTNTELNVALDGKDDYDYLSKWFNNLWTESEKGDFTEMLQETLEECWVRNKEVTPFRIYLKTLHEIFSIEEEPPDISEKIGEIKLYNFQIDAVIDAYQKIKKYGGVFLADVPGLGKTIMGTALLANLQEDGKKAVVIGPPNLQENWEGAFRSLGVYSAKFISHGSLNKIIEDKKLMNSDVILIDEAHHFRNSDSQRYQDMQIICENKKVVLVGATPQNLGSDDLYNQIKLFTPFETVHQFRINPPSLKDFFNSVKKGEANLDDLISEIIIRRTRKDVIENWGEDIEFPTRKGPYRVEYSIDEVYDKGIYKKINEFISNLTFARYDIGSYIKEEEFSEEEIRNLKFAGKNLRKLMRIVLFRRLESSVAALRDSARWMKVSQDAFLLALSQGKVLMGESADDVYDQVRGGVELGDIEIPDIAESAEKFKVSRLKKNIEKDRKILGEMEKLVAVEEIPPDEDDKLQELIKRLKSSELSGKKAIIFTQFSSTAEYLGEELKKEFDKVDYVSQKTGQKMTKAYRFSPASNDKDIPKDEEIDILVSTEILSEGLNLQDGQIVINYELHWNPVRIVQRIGRVDRIGSKHDKIFVYNFFPQTEVEKEIGVEAMVKKRIDEIIKFYGADEKTISMDEEEVRKKLYEIYTGNERSLQEEEIRSTCHKHYQEWKNIKKNYQEEYQKAVSLPSGIRAGKNSSAEGVVVFCKTDDYFQLYLSGKDKKIAERNDWKILSLLSCKVDADNKDVFENHDDITEEIREKFEKEANQREFKKENKSVLKKQIINRLKRIKRGQVDSFKREVDLVIQELEDVSLMRKDEKKLRSILRKYGKMPKEIVNEIKENINGKKKEEKPKQEKKYAQTILSSSLKNN